MLISDELIKESLNHAIKFLKHSDLQSFFVSLINTRISKNNQWNFTILIISIDPSLITMQNKTSTHKAI